MSGGYQEGNGERSGSESVLGVDRPNSNCTRWNPNVPNATAKQELMAMMTVNAARSIKPFPPQNVLMVW